MIILRIGITSFPTDGIDISVIPVSGGSCVVRLFKDEESTTDSEGNAVLTADAVEGKLIYYAGLHDEIKNNFDTYWTQFYNAEYQKRLDALNASYAYKKQSLHERHSSILLSPVLTEAQQQTAITNIKADYATLIDALIKEQGEL